MVRPGTGRVVGRSVGRPRECVAVAQIPRCTLAIELSFLEALFYYTTCLVYQQVDGWMDGWMDGWTDGWTDGWMDGPTDGRTDGCMDAWLVGSSTREARCHTETPTGTLSHGDPNGHA
eukprot:355264-Chlamydomonas_euryale.AAC.4